MIKKVVLALTILGCLTPALVFGAAGIYDSYAIVNNQFYDLGASSVNPDFQGANLGSFDTSQSISLGGQEKSFKNNGTDVTGHFLDYRIWSVSPSGSFSEISYPFQWNAGDSGAPGNLNNPGDQQWGTDVQGANNSNAAVSIALTNFTPGTYSLELFSYINTNSVDSQPQVFNNNNGPNYVATFTIVPEPSTLSLLAAPGILGAIFFARRRRA